MSAPAPSPTPPVQLNNPRILVRDFQASWRFYRETIGLGKVLGDGTPPYGELGDSEHFVGLFLRAAMDDLLGPAPARPAPEDRITLIFEVPDVDETHSRLTSMGVPFVFPPTDRTEWGLRTAHLRDPDGNLVELYTRLKPAAK